MINILIVDDEAPARAVIKHYLQDFAELQLVGEADNGFDAMRMIKEQCPQLIFLDIQMPKLNGFELLELLDDPPEIIFSTAFEQYAIRAFEQNAIDYLLKPYSKQRFASAIQKAIAKINAGKINQPDLTLLRETLALQPIELSRIAVKDGQQIHVLPVHEIKYLEADGDYVKLHTSKSVFLKEKTMKYFEENLPKQLFIRVHRSFILNVDEVAKIELYEKENYRVHLKNGEVIKASNSGYKALKAAVRL